MALARITITIPADLVAAADRRAEQLERSRSWLVVDALRSYLAGLRQVVSEAAPTYAPGLDPGRRAQLQADLALSREERVRLAERTATVAELRGRVPQRHRIIAFDRHDDFHAWERRESIDP